MDHSDLVDLIREGVRGAGRAWADLGCGTGNFTLALAELLGPGARITAVDRDSRALRVLAERVAGKSGVEVITLAADFTRPLPMNGLDGLLMANSLHFVKDKAPVVERLAGMLRPQGRFVLVEYATERGNPWVPHPLSFASWSRLAEACGLADTRLLTVKPSRHFGGMYGAASRRP